jgi:arylsulfatase A-like enzyme
VSDDELAKMVALYDGEIAYTDAKLGRVLDRVLGDNRRTVVCVTSDHGEEFLEHGGFFHGYTLYEEVLRVPLVFAGPERGRGVVDVPLGHADLLPTLLDLLGRPGAELYTGRSLAPLLRGEGPFAPSAQIAETGFRRPHRVATVSGDDKWILRTVDGAVEGYDLARDPEEQDDRAAEASARAAEVGRALAEWVDAQERRFEPFFQGEPGRAGPVDAEALRKLGYFDSLDQ